MLSRNIANGFAQIQEPQLAQDFYLIEIAKTLVQQMNVPEQEVNFIVYEAYKYGVFVPIK